MTGSRKPQVCPLHGAPVGTEGAFWGPTGPHRPSRGIGGVLDNRKSTGLSREGDWQAPAARETCSNGPSTTFSLFSSRQGRCFNFTLVRPPYRPVPCSPKICLPPSQACFPINGCYSRCQHPAAVCSRLPSRMLPLISPPTRAVCGTTLSLPPP